MYVAIFIVSVILLKVGFMAYQKITISSLNSQIGKLRAQLGS